MSSSPPRSLQWWLGGLVAAVALPVLALLILVCVAQVQREQLEARQAALRMARATAARMRDMHTASLGLLARMAARPAIVNDMTVCRSVFSVVDLLPRYADVFLFDAAGNPVCSGNTLPENRRVSILARSWIENELRAGRLPQKIAVMHTFESHSMMMLATPVPNAGTIVLLEFAEAIGRDALIPDAVITILDRNGTIVARSGASEEWTGIADLAATASEGLGETTGADGVARQYGFTHLPELGWSVYAGVPTAAINQPIREMLVNGAVGGIGIVFIVVVMTMMLARKIGRPIHALVAAARTSDDGAYSTVPTVEGPLEIATLTRAFNEMVASRGKSEQALKALSDRLLVVQEEERTRIAREIHDDLGQTLTALKMDVIGMMDMKDDAPGATAIRQRVLATLNSTVRSVQRISSELRPSMLDDLGLAAAIESEAHVFEERTGIECEVSLPDEMLQIDGVVATTVYRIIQEALTNVARHSNAARVELRVRVRSAEVLLEVRDDGRGITSQEVGSGRSLGLIGIRERAAIVGGSTRFEGIEGSGTIVSVRIPVSTVIPNVE
ncbi:MAG TPA: histidine kinase [Thermoanaerobaculia bacterium]|jgi:signal transduction histidine kinase|nr:histidine kinase [Thermoanaerobaculia bacterium]